MKIGCFYVRKRPGIRIKPGAFLKKNLKDTNLFISWSILIILVSNERLLKIHKRLPGMP
jgi:hypothetical protein